MQHESNDNSFLVFTVCNIAYLPKALVLAESLYKYHNKKLNVVLFDNKQEFRYPTEHIEITWVEDLAVPKWRELAFMYDIIEFSTSLKPHIALKLLDNHEKVVFLDPDTCLFSEIDPILIDLDTAPVLVTPHYIKPQPDTGYESDLAMMRFGSFNMGFFGVRKGREAKEFLEWWNKRCIDFSFMESQFGLSTDQKWISIAPCFFQFMKISFHVGYNAAPWNTFERKITHIENGKYILNNKYPLIFFHFSNFDHADPQYLNKRASSESFQKYEKLETLGKYYSNRLKEMEDKVDKIPYSYDYFDNGSYISPTLRRAYASRRSDIQIDYDPFEFDGPIGRFAVKNYLVGRKSRHKYTYPRMNEAAKHTKILSVIYLFMKAILLIVGPNRFYDLSKLFVFLSIYRKNHKLWKI